MRPFTVVSAVVVVGALLASCSAHNSQSVSGSGGTASGTTLQISIVDKTSALIGGDIFGSASSGFDRIDGDLVQDGAGTWRGTVTGTAERTINVVVLDDDCKTSLAGTQQLEAVATKGTFEEGRNLRIVLSPLGPPSYSTYPECTASNPKDKAANGIEWLWFYLAAYKDAGMEVKLPPSPGGTWEWEFNPSETAGYPGGCGDLELFRCTQTTKLTVEYR